MAGRFELHYPVKNPVILQPFGVNWTGDPDFYKKFDLCCHEGVDFKAPLGTPVLACADGIVSRIERSEFEGSGSAYGIQIRIKHQDGAYESIYAHLQEVSIALSVGDAVMQGQQIGLSDNTGNSRGSHLHLSLKKFGNTEAGIKQQIGDGSWVLFPSDLVDPTPYFLV